VLDSVSSVVGDALGDSVGIVLLWAALQKSRDRSATDEMLGGMGIPKDLRLVVGLTICAVEAGVGAGLLLLPERLPILVAGVAVCGALVAVSAWFLARGGDVVQCSCFGRSDRKLGQDTIVGALLLLISASASLAFRVSLEQGQVAASTVITALIWSAALLGVYRVASAARTLGMMRRHRRGIDASLEMHALGRSNQGASA
jgi:hypothetical protein